jgi:hypothetical protein
MTGTSGRFLSAVFIITLATVAMQCRKDSNPVFGYLNNAEVQCENGEQRATLKTAMNDILTLSGRELEMKRYRDYRGRENRWDLPTLLVRHFLPDDTSKTLGENFYTDVKSPEVTKLAGELSRRLGD